MSRTDMKFLGEGGGEVEEEQDGGLCNITVCL